MQGFWRAWLVLAIGWAACPTAAQDQITVRDRRTGKVSQFQAQVISWDSEQLVYSGNGRQTAIPSSRVTAVDYPRTANQLAGDQHFADREFLPAWQSYENAIAEEPRSWVKVEIMARQLQCARALNRQPEALQVFFAIRQETPRSRFFHLIPIPWAKSRPAPTLLDVYREWSQSGDETQQLIAGSWLMLMDEAAATEVLRNLARSEDPEIAHLAAAQLWRGQTLSMRESDLSRWKASMARMPEALQAGPRFLIALAQRQLNRNGADSLRNEALVGMLQVPILHPEQYQLCGAALLEAHQMLVAADRPDEAQLVLNELQRDYGLSNAALSLTGRVENLDQQ